MLMVDYINELSDTKVITQFKITLENLFVEDNKLQESGLIENAAQTCASIVGQTFFMDENNQIKEDVQVIGFISGIKNLKIYELPQVNHQLTTTAFLNSRFDTEAYSICTIVCQTYCESKLLLDAEINLVIQEKK